MSDQLSILNHSNILKIQSIISSLNEEDNLEKKQSSADEIISLFTHIERPENKKIKLIIPSDIKEEIEADLNELNKCMQAECYRSVTILCGRILEVALHRKYFDATGFDILEKNPGIGLGKLIAKLAEKEVLLDPGLTQQIHLINQVRIFSVHKKQQVFYPCWMLFLRFLQNNFSF